MSGVNSKKSPEEYPPFQGYCRETTLVVTGTSGGTRPLPHMSPIEFERRWTNQSN
jgi:hypothetical protein